MENKSDITGLKSEPEKLNLDNAYVDKYKKEIFTTWLTAYIKGVDMGNEFPRTIRNKVPKALALMAVKDLKEFHDTHFKGE